jgi:hypothetical protein
MLQTSSTRRAAQAADPEREEIEGRYKKIGINAVVAAATCCTKKKSKNKTPYHGEAQTD